MHACTLHTCESGDREEWSWGNSSHKVIFVLDLKDGMNQVMNREENGFP